MVPVSGKRDEDEPLVYCAWDGTWWAGRYVGSLSFEGNTLTIEPRFGLDTLRNWMREATSVVLTDSPGKLREDETFIVQLLASVWAHGFVEAARHGLSRQIANRRGIAADVGADGETKGVLLDVAELWEMYVLSVLRKAVTPMTVTHGTREKGATKKLLHSNVTGRGLGTLIPDAILHNWNGVRGVVDAKYKSLHPSEGSPNGPQREDLYQMAAYLGRFRSATENHTLGVLAYPLDPSRPSTPYAELNSPWSLEDDKRIGFICLPHEPAAAIEKVRHFISHLMDQHLRPAPAVPTTAGPSLR